MYNVDAKFHQLIAAGAKTRCRIYLFDKTVDPTDNADVIANGTLLKMLNTDTDSNGRIEQQGISFTDIFNKDTNVQVGCVESLEMNFGLINTDGAYSGYSFERCKVFIDAYDSSTTSWHSCPMGVYIVEQPQQTYSSIIHIRAFDLMQDLGAIADTWFNGIDWTTPRSISYILQSLATECGKPLSNGTLANLVNANVTYESAPFVSTARTFRDILAWIAEVTATNARFDRDGHLELRWFAAVNYSVNANQIGCGVFSIVRGEYDVSSVDGLKCYSYKQDEPITVGGSNSVYQISGNPFFTDDIEQLSNAVVGYAIVGTAVVYYSNVLAGLAMPILSRMNGLGRYTPLQMRIITDPSVEAGDIISVTYGETVYSMPRRMRTTPDSFSMSA